MIEIIEGLQIRLIRIEVDGEKTQVFDDIPGGIKEVLESLLDDLVFLRLIALIGGDDPDVFRCDDRLGGFRVMHGNIAIRIGGLVANGTTGQMEKTTAENGRDDEDDGCDFKGERGKEGIPFPFFGFLIRIHNHAINNP